MLLGQFEIHPSTKLEGFGHLTPSSAGIHIPSPERHRGEQASSQNWAEHFPSSAPPTGNLRLLHQKTLTDHFPEAFSLYFPVSHSPPRPCNFYLHFISLGENSENQDFDQFFQRANEKAFSASERDCLFPPGSTAL